MRRGSTCCRPPISLAKQSSSTLSSHTRPQPTTYAYRMSSHTNIIPMCSGACAECRGAGRFGSHGSALCSRRHGPCFGRCPSPSTICPTSCVNHCMRVHLYHSPAGPVQWSWHVHPGVRGRLHPARLNLFAIAHDYVMFIWLMQILGIKRIEIIYVESICRVSSLSLSAKLLYYFAGMHLFARGRNQTNICRSHPGSVARTPGKVPSNRVHWAPCVTVVYQLRVTHAQITP